jgi:hypothetical protein
MKTQKVSKIHKIIIAFLSIIILSLLLFTTNISSLLTASLVQSGTHVYVTATYNGRCGSGTSNQISFYKDNIAPKYGTVQVPCSAPSPQLYLQNYALTYANPSIYDTVYLNNIIYQPPIYNPDYPTSPFLEDISLINAPNIDVTINKPLAVLLTFNYPTQDTNYKDLNMTISWYKSSLLDSLMNPIKDSSFKQVPSSPSPIYINYEFIPTSETVYFITGTVVTQQYTFTDSWYLTSESVTSRDVKQITSSRPIPITPTPTPTPTPTQTYQPTPTPTPTQTPDPKTNTDNYPLYILIIAIGSISLYILKSKRK